MRDRAHDMARLLSAMLVGLGVAVFVRTALADGFSGLRLGYLAGPALVVAGIARMKLAGGWGAGKDER
jgi:hypothetical protein